ncbi:MAG TPA: hypothetical protein VJ203_02420 [Bacteroidales bacterium]|nr:hypothetical protein [Bacteroidales bacterium]
MKFEIKTILILLPLFFLLNPGTTWSQNTVNQFTQELNITFDAAEVKKLERAVKLLDEADRLLQEANQQFSLLTGLEKKERVSSAYDAALKKLFTSSETYREACNLAYSVFRDRGEVFWKKMSRVSHRASGMEKAKYYEGSGLKNLNRSLIRRQQVLESDRFEYSLGIMHDACDLEKLAVRDQSRAVQICSDYPVEYNYGWEDDKTIQEIVALMKDPNVHEPPNDIFATVDKSAKVDSAIYKEVIFKVQIAAHTLPLTEEYLNAIYKGAIKIDMIYEEDWYKYSIGIYKSFDEADATLREVNIKKAFVVAYQEGKKISTQEAIQLTADRP